MITGATDTVIKDGFVEGASLDCTPDGELVVCAPDGFRYRRSVYVFIMNGHGFFLGCRRCDDKKVLQCVQGGVMAHETPQQAAEREMFEEIGLSATRLCFLGEVRPFETSGDAWAAFRYNSKSWRKLGIKGQELCPLLYLADMEIVHLLNFRAFPQVRQEFCGACWVTLEELMQKASPSKATVTANICAAVEPLARHVFGVEGLLPLNELVAAQSIEIAKASRVKNTDISVGGCKTDAAGVGNGGGGRSRYWRRKNQSRARGKGNSSN